MFGEAQSSMHFCIACLAVYHLALLTPNLRFAVASVALFAFLFLEPFEKSDDLWVFRVVFFDRGKWPCADAD